MIQMIMIMIQLQMCIRFRDNRYHLIITNDYYDGIYSRILQTSPPELPPPPPSPPLDDNDD